MQVTVPTTETRYLPIGGLTLSTDGATAFRRNADGSVTVLQAGFYDVEATVAILANAAGYQAAYIAIRANDSPFAANDATVGGSPKFGNPSSYVGAALTVAGKWKLNANDRLYVLGSHQTGANRDMQTQLFSIARVGAGPKGPTARRATPARRATSRGAERGTPRPPTPSTTSSSTPRAAQPPPTVAR